MHDRTVDKINVHVTCPDGHRLHAMETTVGWDYNCDSCAHNICLGDAFGLEQAGNEDEDANAVPESNRNIPEDINLIYGHQFTVLITHVAVMVLHRCHPTASAVCMTRRLATSPTRGLSP